MTTIAYKDGILAADRLISEGGDRYGYATKIGSAVDAKGKRVLYGACGATSIAQRWRDWVEHGLAAGDGPPDMGDEVAKAHGFLFYEDGELVTFDPHQPPFRTEMMRVGLTSLASFGGGSSFALGAMMMAASAPEAILVACRFNLNTGGGVDVVSFRDPTVKRATLLTPI